MVNKVIIGILVFLVVLNGGLSMHSYLLSQQINALSEQLTSSQEEQATQIGAVTDELIAFKGESLNKIGILRKELDGTVTKIDILGEEIDGAMTKINVVQNETRGEIRDLVSELSQSVLNATKIYQEATQAVVRITDGERVIGSGFIIDDEGHVVTAQHVIEDITEIEVILADGSISAATLVGSSRPSDVAILALENAPAAKPLRFADSATLLVGQPVVTIGNPLNLTATLTSGVVSQFNGYLEIEYDSQRRPVANLIQFDAPVNFGNSGCPLLNSRAEVIGMVIARVNPERGDGIYYAVSSNKLKRVTASLINQGFFDYPWLGVDVTDLTPQEAKDRELDTINGVLVNEVLAGGPAETAGIKVDDIIVAIDGQTIRNVADLTSYLGEHKTPGEKATLTLIRGKTKLELPLEIGKRS